MDTLLSMCDYHCFYFAVRAVLVRHLQTLSFYHSHRHSAHPLKRALRVSLRAPYQNFKYPLLKNIGNWEFSCIFTELLLDFYERGKYNYASETVNEGKELAVEIINQFLAPLRFSLKENIFGYCANYRYQANPSDVKSDTQTRFKMYVHFFVPPFV